MRSQEHETVKSLIVSFCPDTNIPESLTTLLEYLTWPSQIIGVDDDHTTEVALNIDERAIHVLLQLAGDDVDQVVGDLLCAATGAVGLLQSLDDGLVADLLDVAPGPAGLFPLLGDGLSRALVDLLTLAAGGCLHAGGARLACMCVAATRRVTNPRQVRN